MHPMSFSEGRSIMAYRFKIFICLISIGIFRYIFLRQSHYKRAHAAG